ncbi:unnamed protein product [Linum tenue]|uniref:Uncharacterized protein n=1 Tax=Linum tenue TaxID=586396 RepID=A0AAV0KVT6_9ROSI|nr:unnamed protein product [Linum tenue]
MKDVNIEEPNPQQPPTLEQPQKDHQGNQVSPIVGMEHLTHAFLDNIPEQFKANLLLLQDLLQGRNMCLNWILFA